jgi:hypothetical protein
MGDLSPHLQCMPEHTPRKVLLSILVYDTTEYTISHHTRTYSFDHDFCPGQGIRKRKRRRERERARERDEGMSSDIGR